MNLVDKLIDVALVIAAVQLLVVPGLVLFLILGSGHAREQQREVGQQEDEQHLRLHAEAEPDEEEE